MPTAIRMAPKNLGVVLTLSYEEAQFLLEQLVGTNSNASYRIHADAIRLALINVGIRLVHKGDVDPDLRQTIR